MAQQPNNNSYSNNLPNAFSPSRALEGENKTEAWWRSAPWRSAYCLIL